MLSIQSGFDLSRYPQDSDEESVEAEEPGEISDGEMWDCVLECGTDRECDVRCPLCKRARLIGREVLVVRCGCDQDASV